MKERHFRFKKFEVSHRMSAMKVGVDGVLIGAWGQVGEDKNIGSKILDIGTGCGVIALMAAQRNSNADIIAVEIDDPSADEAEENFKVSPWAERLRLLRRDATCLKDDVELSGTFDHILSNPPFFEAGISKPATPREKARHTDSLSPFKVLMIAEDLLKEGGTVSLIAPIDSENEIKSIVERGVLNLLRITRVSDRPTKFPKRILLEFVKGSNEIEKRPINSNTLHIRDDNGEYSKAYKDLTKEFYLNF